MAEIKSRSLDHLARAFALREQYVEAAEIWETRVSLAKTPLERTYLFHEIGRCYMELNKLDIAKYYGNQSLEEASKIHDDIWAMNARIFLGQIESNAVTLIFINLRCNVNLFNNLCRYLICFFLFFFRYSQKHELGNRVGSFLFG